MDSEFRIKFGETVSTAVALKLATSGALCPKGGPACSLENIGHVFIGASQTCICGQAQWDTTELKP